MFKSLALFAVSASARWAPVYDGTEDFAHDVTWGHDHYEPGDVNSFNSHYAEIYGADDLAWGPNGFANPVAAKDNLHNWDDQGDAYVCHACGGHGCGLCSGYGHFHRNAQFGYHGHNLMNGFGVGHWHAYLGPKVRSSYDKYGHGIGGRYSQRWSNGYGDRYGINSGERYGLMHRWGMYNGIGAGNPSSKGSNMGYGVGTNAQVPELYWYDDHHYDDGYDYYYDDDYHYDDEYDMGYDDYYYESDYHYAEDDHVDDMYEEPVEEVDSYDNDLFQQALYPSEEHYYPEEEVAHEEDYHHDDEYHYGDYDDEYNYYDDYDMGYDSGYDNYYPEYYVDWASGYGQYPDEFSNPVGQGWQYPLSFGNGHGNHSPWHNEYERNYAGMMEYRKRPEYYEIHHQPQGFYNN